MPTAFELLHEGVRRRLHEMKWESLRPIQDASIVHVLGDRRDCVISAPTAGGKTEAAFLPILSRIADDNGDGVRAMYVGPLKALINDQFRRIEDLCGRLEIPVHKWHGDVGESQKKALLTRPSGVLLITPESLEAMFVLRPTHMPKLFGRLQFVVIDELHAFIGSVRGAQLQSQLFRLQERCGVNPVRIGLSATLGDPISACQWLRPDGVAAVYINDPSSSRPVSVRVRAFWKRPPIVSQAIDEGNDESDEETLKEVSRSILRSCHAQTNLAFANAKSRIEELADSLKSESSAMGVRHDVVVHHGSLSKDEREFAEERLRNDQPCTAVCSNTLEMGIDIGEVDSVIQLSAPWSVASLTQRLGRSGRREGAPAVLRAYFIEEKAESTDSVWERLHLDFLRGVAMVELVLERFSEPPDVRRPHLSTLVHQLLSSVAETGGVAPDKLYRRLSGTRAFGELSVPQFSELLRALGTAELISQMAEGDIILGAKGEKLREHFSFYAAFVAVDEYRVVHGSREVGSLPSSMLPGVGENVILAGRRWKIELIDTERKEVSVRPSQGRRLPKFNSMGGDIHRRVHQRMLQLIESTIEPVYLDETAREVLAAIRQATGTEGGVAPSVRGYAEGGRTRLFLWAGSKVQRTILLALRLAGFEVQDEAVGLDVKAPKEGVVEVLGRLASGAIPGKALAAYAQKAFFVREVGGDKFDRWLPESLWAEAYAVDKLDLEGARVLALYLTGSAGGPAS